MANICRQVSGKFIIAQLYYNPFTVTPVPVLPPHQEMRNIGEIYNILLKNGHHSANFTAFPMI